MSQIQFETSKVFGLFVKDITPEFTDLHPQYSHYLNQGFVSNLTEEQKEGVCKDADEFASLLTSLNVLLVNPYGENEPKPIIYYENHGQNFGSERIEDWQEVIDWQTTQQHVGNWILLTANK